MRKEKAEKKEQEKRGKEEKREEKRKLRCRTDGCYNYYHDEDRRAAQWQWCDHCDNYGICPKSPRKNPVRQCYRSMKRNVKQIETLKVGNKFSIFFVEIQHNRVSGP